MDQVDAVCALLRDALGESLLGAYQFGSGVDGGLKPASDLDFLAVVSRTLDEAQRSALVDRLLPISGSTTGLRSVELTVVVLDAVRPWRYPPSADFLFGDWLRDEIALHGAPWPRVVTNLAIELSQVLSAGQVLEGPEPIALLDPVPAGNLVRAGWDGIPALLEDLDSDTRNVLLTLARIWVTTEIGAILPKDRAAQWASARLPPNAAAVLQHARTLYLTTTYAAEQPWSAELRNGIGPCVDAILERIGWPQGSRPVGRWSSGSAASS